MGTTCRNLTDCPTTNLPQPTSADYEGDIAIPSRMCIKETNRSPDVEHKSLH